MDFLYSQLPEIVYDPADLTGGSPSGTIKLNIDNVKREILLDVLKAPGTLTIKSPNDVSYKYDGSKDIEMDISKFFDVKIEYKIVTSEDIEQGKLPPNFKVGDSYLCIENFGKFTYALIPTPVTSSEVQKITSISTIYNDVDDLPQGVPLGSIYPVMKDIGGGHKGIVLYEKKESEYAEKSRVAKGNVYVVLDSGLLAIASTNLEFTVLDSVIKGIQSLLIKEIDFLKSNKQDNLNFTEDYNSEDNKVVVESSLGKAINDVKDEIKISLENVESNLEALGVELNSKNNALKDDIKLLDSRVDSLDSRVDILDSRIDVTIEDFNKAVSIESITLSDRNPNDNKWDYVQTFKDGKQSTFQIDKAPRGDKGEKGEKGEKGDTGTGISQIRKTKTENRIDTYEIRFTDGTSTEFNIVNGEKGDQGLPGEKGKDGSFITNINSGIPETTGDFTKTPLTISLSDNSSLTTSIYANIGSKGETGPQGPQGEKGDKGDQGPQGEKGEVGDPIQIKSIFESIEEMNSSSAQLGDFAVLLDPSNGSKLFLFNGDKYSEVASFDNIQVPNDLIIDSKDKKLKLISGGKVIGEGVAFSATGATKIDSKRDGSILILQLKDSNDVPLGDAVEIPVGGAADIGDLQKEVVFLRQQISDLQYEPIAITSFNIQGGNIKVKGESISEATLEWELNKAPTQVILNGNPIDDLTLNKATFTNLEITQDNPKTWVLKVIDDKGGEAVEETEFQFCNYVYYGIGNEENASSDFINSLGNKILPPQEEYNFYLSPNGQYIYYALPKLFMGSQRTIRINVDGFEGGFEPSKEIEVVNDKGFLENYLVYRSTNKITGAINVNVKIK